MIRVLQNPFWRFLARLGDLAVIGLLVSVAAVPIVTLPAAVAAGAAVSHDPDGLPLKAFWRHWIACLRRGLPWGVVGAVVAFGSAADLLLQWQLPPVPRAVAVTAATAAVLLATGIGPYVGLVLRVQHVSFRASLRAVSALVVLAPGGILEAVGLAGLIAASLLIFPIAAVVFVGLYAAVAIRVEQRIEQRLARSAPARPATIYPLTNGL